MDSLHIIILENLKLFKFAILVLIFSTFASNFALAQEQYQYQLGWSSEVVTELPNYTFNCPSGTSTECQKVRLDTEGNVIVAGTSLVNGNYDFLIVKYTNAGTLLWEKLINISNDTDDRVADIFLDANDNIFVAGISKINQNQSKSILMKLDGAGSIIWQTNYPISNEYLVSTPFSMTVDDSGNTYVTGIVSNINRLKMFICKFDVDGVLIWDDVYGPNDSTVYYGRNIRIINNVIVVLGNWALPENKQMILLKYSMGGERLYSNETFYDDRSFDVSSFIDENGNSYFGLRGDFKVIKFDPNGNQIWQFNVPTNLPENVFADKVEDIVTDTDGNVYITGRHYGENYGDPDNYTNGDLQVNKISPEGNEIYSYRYENLGTNTGEGGYKLYLGIYGYLAVGGYSDGSANSDSKYLAVVLNQLGEPVDILKFYEPGTDNDITSVVMDEELNLYVTGTANYKAITQQYRFTGELSNPNFPAIEDNIAPYPNPFSNSLVIDTANISGLVSFTLYNANGSIVTQRSFDSGIKEFINTSSLPSGFYFYKIENGTKSNSGKLIKK